MLITFFNYVCQWSQWGM